MKMTSERRRSANVMNPAPIATTVVVGITIPLVVDVEVGWGVEEVEAVEVKVGLEEEEDDIVKSWRGEGFDKKIQAD